MPFAVGETARRNLALSLPLLQARRAHLVDAMAASLRAAEGVGEDSGQSDISAMVLVDLLLAQGRRLVETGRLGDLRDTLALHRAIDLGGRHYSRFGDALVAIVEDASGPGLPPEVAAAWCDVFWAVIREVTAEEEIVRA